LRRLQMTKFWSKNILGTQTKNLTENKIFFYLIVCWKKH
jgi:hypothetical protein